MMTNGQTWNDFLDTLPTSAEMHDATAFGLGWLLADADPEAVAQAISAARAQIERDRASRTRA